MSTLRVDNIQLNQEGNASISIANSYNVVFTTDGIERVKISKDGFNLAGTGALKVPTGNTAVRPAVPEPGQVRYNTTTGKFEGYGAKWAAIGSGAEIGDAAPSNSGSGDLWWNSSDGKMYIYYVDANSSQWVDISAGTGGQYLPLTGGDVSGNVSVSGNFGIGTTTPSTKLEIVGSSGVSFTGTTRLGLTVRGSSSNTDYSGIDLIGFNQVNPTARIGVLTNTNGSTLTFGTSNNYVNGITNLGASLDFNGNFAFNSGYGSAAVAYGCRAWVNFNGTGTVAIRADGGVSSITDNGTGSYTVNFDVALPDTNYAVSGFSSRDTNGFGHVAQYGVNAVTDMAVGSIRVQCIGYTSSFDAALVCVSVFR